MNDEEKVRWFKLRFWHPYKSRYGFFIWIGWHKLSIEWNTRTDITRYE